MVITGTLVGVNRKFSFSLYLEVWWCCLVSSWRGKGQL